MLLTSPEKSARLILFKERGIKKRRGTSFFVKMCAYFLTCRQKYSWDLGTYG